MATSNVNWIKQRLPSDIGDHLTKNGISMTVDAAVAQALADHSGETGAKYDAIADVLEIMVADVKFRKESEGDYSYDTSVLEDRIRIYRSDADAANGTGGTGSFQSVPATYNSANSGNYTEDEYSS